jgi:peptidyl-prolyl cis-trans isomerase D
VLDDKDGNYYVVRVDSVTPSQPKPFNEVRDELTALWKKMEQAKKAAAESTEIAKELRNGANAQKFAGNKGVSIRTSKPISALGEKDPSLPESGLAQILGLKKGEVVTMADGNMHFVIRLAALTDVDPAKDQKAYEDYRDELKKTTQADIAEQYSRYMRTERYPVEIHQDVMQAIRAQGE